MNEFVEVSKGGKFPSGLTEIPFEVLLKPKNNRSLFETYHGYLLRCEIKRPMLVKDIQKVIEFFVEYVKPIDISLPISDSMNLGICKTSGFKSIHFVLTPESIKNVRDKNKVPKFKIKGSIDATICHIWEPFTGELIIEQCEQVIKSIELQFVRIETCGCAENYACEGLRKFAQ
ncbi:Down syndrome critical region protein 3-like protein [Sarcoptes scabiei]|uniref:Down syndrome critical region protein 3-like protein n=1 Tax=Sarcoptes scabiei TaxID=52283 RepID=A0A132A1G3_SARSC|nr:Down syndrome critical region protein 3-like protein [Sarcoptes scabiei]